MTDIYVSRICILDRILTVLFQKSMYAGTATLSECSPPFGFLWGSAVRFSCSLIVPYLVIFYLIPAKFMRPHRHFTTFPSAYWLWWGSRNEFRPAFLYPAIRRAEPVIFPDQRMDLTPKRGIACPLTSSKTWQKASYCTIFPSQMQDLWYTQKYYINE